MIIAVASYSEPTISKTMKTIMTRCEKLRIFETTSKARKKMKLRTRRNCKYIRGTSTTKRRRASSKLTRIKCKKKRKLKECTKKKSNHDQLYICRASNSCKKIYTNLESSILAHTHLLLVWMTIALIAFATTLICL